MVEELLGGEIAKCLMRADGLIDTLPSLEQGSADFERHKVHATPLHRFILAEESC